MSLGIQIGNFGFVYDLLARLSFLARAEPPPLNLLVAVLP
jgi:hypothetical protein